MHITFIVKFVEGIGVDRKGIWGEEGLKSSDWKEMGQRNVLSSNRWDNIFVSVVVLLSEYTAKRFEKEIEADRDVQIRIVQMFAFESKWVKRNSVDFSEEWTSY